jgi:bifunctional N-acetylglucosamine-1-phosphate-uridyltransferase/glucosamine-1-phosphate-acetyltransferase GlmU-like protein
MVMCAVNDLPFIRNGGGNITFVCRDFHQSSGLVSIIKRYFPDAQFITIEKITEGQACTCMIATDSIDLAKPLIIAGCDNGLIYDKLSFATLTEKCDMIAFTYRNDERVLQNPCAYGWIKADSEGKIKSVSVKRPVSENPLKDHAITATFWFRNGNIFVNAANKMIENNDRINNEFYVDTVIKYVLESGYDTRIFEVERYIGWGTPEEYETYMKTITYWKEFVESKFYLGTGK